jgi:hypothetical protein
VTPAERAAEAKLGEHGLVRDRSIEPPVAARAVAREALALRDRLPRSRRGGLDAAEARRQGITSGVEQAKRIAAGAAVDAAQVKRFFVRFATTVARARADGRTGATSKAILAWDLWGGDPMWDAVEVLLASGE